MNFNSIAETITIKKNQEEEEREMKEAALNRPDIMDKILSLQILEENLKEQSEDDEMSSELLEKTYKHYKPLIGHRIRYSVRGPGSNQPKDGILVRIETKKKVYSDEDH